MKITDRLFGRTRDGRDVVLYTLSGTGGVEVSVMTYGATLVSLKTPDRSGTPGEVTLGFDSLEPYLDVHPYFGATIGRVANRIAGGRFNLDGREYRLALNEEGRTHLHGGNVGFDRALWSAEISENRVVFSYLCPDGEEGYPGNLEVKAIYALTDQGELIFEYLARTDKATPVNLTNHTYWNFAGNGTILDHELQMSCDRYLPIDANLIPTGEIRDVSREPAMDFRSTRRIGERIGDVPGGYDHCHVIEPAGARGPAPVLRVRDSKTGRGMQMWSTQPGVQLYTGNFLDGIRGRCGTRYHRHTGFSAETQGFPNAVNEPRFPSCVLRPGETYHHVIRLRFFAE